MTSEHRIITYNKKVSFEYFIEEKFEAGIVLLGSEVKSLRQGKISIGDSFVDERKGELYLVNCHISEYKGANRFNHDPLRARKLLLHKKEINKLIGKLHQKGKTLVPVSFYFNRKNIVKLEIALVSGKKLYDKREAIKEREWKRDKQRMLKVKNLG